MIKQYFYFKMLPNTYFNIIISSGIVFSLNWVWLCEIDWYSTVRMNVK